MKYAKEKQLFSHEHMLYLKRRRRRQAVVWTLRVALLVFLLAAWELVTTVFG